MTKILLTTLAIMLVIGNSFCQKKDNVVNFSVIVGSCFEADTVDISINGQKIISDVVVTSDVNTGITQLSVFQNRDGFWILNKNVMTNFGSIALNKALSLEVKVNGRLTAKNLDLRSGRYLVVNNCYGESEDDKLVKSITVSQHKQTIVLE
ncbi:hypothetical protein WG947_10915 [Pontibacter sp. H259]|uniref:hypothetical protein n=1 Tax=Pontibacter sp. H259 TaxID=3133421 RepID=UPI0030C5417E